MPVDHAPIYASRRSRVQELLGESGILVVPASPEIVVGRDIDTRYRPDADLYYLTGYREPGAVLVLGPASADEPYTLFVRPRDPNAERWTGVRGGPEAAAAEFGAVAYPITELEERLPGLLAAAETIYFPLESGRPEVEHLVRRALANGRRTRQRTGIGPRTLRDPGSLLDEARIIKDPHEIELIAAAATLSAEAFLDVVPLIKPGVGEWEIEAALTYGFRRRGADGEAFASIIASGPNATVLHYIDNDRVMKAGELLLIDAGAIRRGYSGDISRTFPVSGRFAPLQREIYDAVLAAHDRAIAAIRPGATIAGVHEISRRTLTEALLGLGILDGDPDEIIEEEQYKPFFPHQTSHWLGLDLHDVGDYARGGESRILEPGMVLTVEPGLYFPPDDDRVPPELRGTGIRIEDDVVVTDSGHEILTEMLPTAATDLEALMD